MRPATPALPLPAAVSARLLAPADAAALAALRLAVLGGARDETAALGQQIAARDRNLMAGAFGPDDSLLAACAVHWADPHPAVAHKALLWGLVVVPEWRRLGLARAVTQLALEQAFARGARRVNLQVYLPNAAAVALYRSLGFEAWGTEPEALWAEGRFQDCLNMSLASPDAASR
ncbi:MAG TPA: GNAT family N-acetyltransferase [Burkholderiaceae bacterium]|nr:GNAT family N-acetyltransferase [Burkholderiaceae bacterium]